MGFRTLEITHSSELHIKNNQLLIEKEGKVVSIPIEDINSIVCMGANIRISTLSLARLADNGITVLSLDERYNPMSIVQPIISNSRQAKVMREQIAMSDERRGQLWREIIIRKIENQSRVLSILGLQGADEVLKYAIQCENADKIDVEFIEAEAARIYFQYYHPGLNRRNDDPVNSRLNYGYAVVRNAIIRELILKGLQPAIGLHHDNQYNAFNLSDDLIEPWRPMVDLRAYSVIGPNVNLTRGERYKLAHILHEACSVNSKKINITHGIQNQVESLYKAINFDDSKLVLPTVIPVESMELLNE